MLYIMYILILTFQVHYCTDSYLILSHVHIFLKLSLPISFQDELRVLLRSFVCNVNTAPTPPCCNCQFTDVSVPLQLIKKNFTKYIMPQFLCLWYKHEWNNLCSLVAPKEILLNYNMNSIREIWKRTIRTYMTNDLGGRDSSKRW